MLQNAKLDIGYDRRTFFSFSYSFSDLGNMFFLQTWSAALVSLSSSIHSTRVFFFSLHGLVGCNLVLVSIFCVLQYHPYFENVQRRALTVLRARDTVISGNVSVPFRFGDFNRRRCRTIPLN